MALQRTATLLILTAFGVDLVTKTLAVELFGGTGPAGWGALAIDVHTNEGLAFSLGEGDLSTSLVMGVRALMLAVLGALLLTARSLSERALGGISLILAGGLGNTADLVLRDGAVVDFLSLRATELGADAVYFVFNLADVWIFFGLLLLLPTIRRGSLWLQAAIQRGERRLLRRLVESI